MDVQTRLVALARGRQGLWRLALGAILLLALALRLQGLHNPILDHPGWRQGDTASIARNFATLQYDIFFPQTDYNGPPPNYVELELQIVPIVAATVYKAVGVHEVIGRLTSIAFSLATVAALALFGRWLFASELAGALAALLFAMMPGSFYYGRTFTPDTAMVFFLSAALYAIARMLVDDETWTPRQLAGATALLALAFLAKPVSLVALVPIGALIAQRALSARTLRWPPIALMLALPLGLLYGYDAVVASHAEWHWASGIAKLHVLPSLLTSLHGGRALHGKLLALRQVLGMLGHTMIGPAISALGILGFVLPPHVVRTRTLLWSWLAGGLMYTYVVVTVERVDYYMYLLLPLAALAGAGFLARVCHAVRASGIRTPLKLAAAAAALAALAAVTWQNARIVKPYYRYGKDVYRNAVRLDETLAPGALVVMGHYDPSILYYIGRYGWEEDPYLWTPFDEQSAIRKGARYFINVEKNRFNRNLELCAWMQRFPVIDARAQWPVYLTDPLKIKPGAEQQWRLFRRAEKRGGGRRWLDARGLCR